MYSKSDLAKLWLEAMLDEGRKVIVASPYGWAEWKRYGKLTSITPIATVEKRPTFVIVDELTVDDPP